jgi:hypothetical protein
VTARFDIAVKAGQHLRLKFTFTHDTGEVDGDGAAIYAPLYNFADARVRMQIRQAPGYPVLAEVSLEGGGGISTGEESQIFVVLTADQTAALVRGYYDIIAEFPFGDTVRLIEGRVLVDPAITEGSPDV